VNYLIRHPTGNADFPQDLVSPTQQNYAPKPLFDMNRTENNLISMPFSSSCFLKLHVPALQA